MSELRTSEPQPPTQPAPRTAQAWCRCCRMQIIDPVVDTVCADCRDEEEQ